MKKIFIPMVVFIQSVMGGCATTPTTDQGLYDQCVPGACDHGPPPEAQQTYANS